MSNEFLKSKSTNKDLWDCLKINKIGKRKGRGKEKEKGKGKNGRYNTQ